MMNDQSPSTLSHPLAYVRTVLLGMGKTQFAKAVRDRGQLLGINLGTTRSTIFKWERGDHGPDEPAQIVIADLLKIPASVRESAPWPKWLPAWDNHVMSAPWTTDNTVKALTALSGSEPMDRRGFLGIGGTALVSIGTQWAAALSPAAEPSVAAADSDSITPSIVDRLSERVHSLRALEQELGGAEVIELGRTDLLLITRLLDNGTYSEHTERHLYALAAEVCCLLGWMSYDASMNSAAQKYYTAALRASKNANDYILGAHTLCFMSVQAANHQEPQAAVELMTAANSVRWRVPPIMQASLAAHQATASLKVGDERHAAKALNRAFAALERVNNDDIPPYLRWFGEAQLRSTEGRFLLATGQAARATDALEKSVDQAARRDKAVRCGTLALAYQQIGDIDGALDATARALALIDEGIHTQRGVERLQEVRKAFAPHRSESRVREACARIAALVAT
ncbi:helix-turn-helix domain-containing protein [Streptomyces hygroscopicus]|uniref:transcriptional regulator n=1 Tax=Streptomyces hygroscopicus TaxID=1912 RepID=UPI00131A82B8|nr:transcriptional regulator [Streptomyces hygroscopicus]